MKTIDLVSLLQKKQIGPRCELIYGDAVVTDVNLTSRWRVEEENGKVTYSEGKPRFETGKNGWPKIEQVTCAEIKIGPGSASPSDRR